MNPFVSVIIPVYNEEKYVIECVNSVLNQPCKDLEIILVNDGSTDNSHNVCLNLAKSDERIKYFSKENTGVSDTRNFAIEKATGKFIAFLDSDDIWVDGVYTEECKDEIINSNCDIAAFAYQMSYADINDIYQTTWPDDPKGARGDRAVDCLYTHFCSDLYSKDLIDSTGIKFPVGVKYLEDFRFQRKIIYLAKNVYRMDQKNKPLFVYRSNPHSVCHKADEFAYSYDVMHAFDDLQEFYKREYESEERSTEYYNAQQALLFLRIAEKYCFVCKSYKEWLKITIDANVLQIVQTELSNGLSFPIDSKETVEKILSNPKKYYYNNKIKSQLHQIRRTVYRFFVQTLMKK